MKKIIKTDNAPKPIGPYNQAVIAGDFIFISGQEIENELAAYSKAITCIVSLLFIVFSVKSFIKARKAKRTLI